MQREKVLETILAIVAGLLLLALVLSVQALHIIALALLGTALAFPFLSEKIALLWLKLAEVLGKINSVLLLSLIFYLVLTPWAFIFRFFHRDNLYMIRKQVGSYYTERDYEYSARDFDNPW